MNLVTVIPISKGIFKEELTYFTSKKLDRGTLVTVPVRNSKVPAIVIGIESLLEAKSSLKNSAFTIKKIDEILGSSFFSAELFKAGIDAGRYFASETGRVLNAMLPAPLLKNYEELVKPKPRKIKDDGIIIETLLFQAGPTDRIASYKTYIREAFAKKESVFICVPTKESGDLLYEHLSKGIEEYVHIIHNGFTENEIIKKTNKILEDTHAVAIIGTGGYLSIPRPDIETIIVEEESSPSYKTVARPFVDFRVIAELIASHLRIKLIIGDTLLRIETRGRLENQECGEFIPLSYRIPKTPKISIIEKGKENGKPVWSVMESETLNLISEYSANNKNSCVLTLKKGYAGSVICGDCSYAISCPNCKGKMELREGKSGDRSLVCADCKKEEGAKMTCPECGSWNLVPLGIGADRVYETLLSKIPKNKIFQIDAINTSTPLRAEKTYKKFLETEGAVLIATEAGFRKWKIKSDLSVVLSTDAILNIPFFKSGERYARLIRDLKDRTKETIIIETKDKEAPIISALLDGQIGEWARNEDSLRKRFGYPPYTNLIEIKWETKKSTVNYRAKLKSEFENYETYETGQGKYGSFVIKIKREEWAGPILSGRGNFNQDLCNKLISLPINLTIEIDPE